MTRLGQSFEQRQSIRNKCFETMVYKGEVFTIKKRFEFCTVLWESNSLEVFIVRNSNIHQSECQLNLFA